MNGFDKLHKEQDDFIKKTLQEDKIVSQPIFDSFSNYMDKTNVKVKRYSYKQQKIIIFLLLLLTISVGLNVYLGIVKQTPISITNIFESANSNNKLPEHDKQPVISNEEVEEENDNEEISNTENTTILDDEDVESTNELPENTVTNTVIEVPSNTTSVKPVNTTLTPTLFTDISTNEVEEFVDQFAIGLNKLNLQDDLNLESNTILLYIAQQYFTAKSNTSNSLTVDTTYASSAENFHKFLSEFTIKDYSTTDYLKSYNNYIGYVAKSKSYVYGKDYSIISKEKYECNDVTITDKSNNIYTAKAKVTKTYDGTVSTYDVTFTFKVNNNYKYQKYKLLSLSSKITSGSLDNTIHLVGN